MKPEQAEELSELGRERLRLYAKSKNIKMHCLSGGSYIPLLAPSEMRTFLAEHVEVKTLKPYMIYSTNDTETVQNELWKSCKELLES